MITAAQVFRAIMVANGDPDPGASAQGMLENSHPAEQEYIAKIAEVLNEEIL